MKLDCRLIFDDAPEIPLPCDDECRDPVIEAGRIYVEMLTGKKLSAQSRTDFPGFSIVDAAGEFVAGG